MRILSLVISKQYDASLPPCPNQFNDNFPVTMNLRVLIVGCGYTGSALAAELTRRGHEVFGLRRHAPPAAVERMAGFTFLRADLTRPETLAGLPRDFDWVVNCAAPDAGGVADYRQVYLTGNQNLAAWLANAPLQKFIFTSSTSVYGQNDGSVVTETSPAAPLAETAKVLVEAENFLLTAGQKLPAAILRVAGIYGPGRMRRVEALLQGEPRLPDNGSRWLNLIHRDDLITAIIAALERGAPGEIYNVVDNEPVRERQLQEWLAARLGCPLPSADPAVTERHTGKRVSNMKLRRTLHPVWRFPDFRAGLADEIRRLTAGKNLV